MPEVNLSKQKQKNTRGSNDEEEKKIYAPYTHLAAVIMKLCKAPNAMYMK